MKNLFVLIALLFSSCTVNNLVTPTHEAGNLPRKEGKHYVLMVNGECEICQNEIEKIARFHVPGVKFAYWLQYDKKLLLDFDENKTNIDSVSIALARWGYDTERHIADAKIYNALPHCCKYR
ncbi:MAG: copper chaperone [Dysgonomonas sp.]|nr:copper chaperone [Dysgonomonas sp.]